METVEEGRPLEYSEYRLHEPRSMLLLYHEYSDMDFVYTYHTGPM